MRLYRNFLLLLLTSSLLLAVGCSEDSAPVKKQQKSTQKRVQKQAAAQDTPVAKKEKKEFVYDPAGKRDPFRPLVAVRLPAEDANVPLTPLQKFELSQFRLIGVIVGKGEPRAMVVAPGGKSYVLKKGQKIGKNHGVVIDIDSETVQIEEKFLDLAGSVTKSIQEISLPPRQGVE